MAHKKGQSSSRNGRDSKPKFLGIKAYGGEEVSAGTIIVQKHAVHGLTTAAGMWVAAGIGMASAAGLYAVAVISTVLALIGLETVGRLNRFLRAKGGVDG